MVTTMSPRERRFQIWGWLLFMVCAILFLLSAAAVFLAACIVFMIPLIRRQPDKTVSHSLGTEPPSVRLYDSNTADDHRGGEQAHHEEPAPSTPQQKRGGTPAEYKR